MPVCTGPSMPEWSAWKLGSQLSITLEMRSKDECVGQTPKDPRKTLPLKLQSSLSGKDWKADLEFSQNAII